MRESASSVTERIAVCCGKLSRRSFGREPEALQRQLDRLGHGRGLVDGADKASHEVRQPDALSDDDAHGADRQWLTGSHDGGIRRRDPLKRRVPGPLLDEEVRVVAPEAEVRDCGAARAVALPRLGLGQQAEAVLVDRIERAVARRGREELRLEGAQHLQETRHTGRGNRMTDVRLERADDRLRRPRPRLGEAIQLHPIAAGRARSVTLDVGDVRRGQPRLLVRRTDRADLPFGRRREESGLSAIVRETHTSDHSEDAITVTDRVVETLQDHEAGTLGRKQAIRSLVQGAGLAARAQRLQGGEAEVDEEGVCSSHPARQHEVGVAVL